MPTVPETHKNTAATPGSAEQAAAQYPATSTSKPIVSVPVARATDDVLPEYALKYAPLVYLHSEDQFFPGLPNEHITCVTPRKFTGEEIPVPDEHKGKLSMLALEQINKPDVFLTIEKNIRSNPNIDELCSPHCKPDKNGKSLSPAWIILRDKTGVCEGEGKIEDVFYFFFYPYNQGNSVLFKHFGNHVGDWEHAMVRFRNGQPECMHLSAHSDGNAWKWDLFEKEGERPVIYSAGGSHAMYPKGGTHNYAGIFLVGPKDHTSRGYLWDPTLNFVCARSHGDPDEPAANYTYVRSPAPGFNPNFSPEAVVAVLSYKGRWGNSFSDLRLRKSKDNSASGSSSGGITSFVKKLKDKVEQKVDDDSGDELHKAEAAAIKGEGPATAGELNKKGVHSLSLYSKLLVLIWAEGPTGPRDKSLERKTVNRWKAELCEAL